jgi:hypothetical protein
MRAASGPVSQLPLYTKMLYHLHFVLCILHNAYASKNHPSRGLAREMRSEKTRMHGAEPIRGRAYLGIRLVQSVPSRVQTAMASPTMRTIVPSFSVIVWGSISING